MSVSPLLLNSDRWTGENECPMPSSSQAQHHRLMIWEMPPLRRPRRPPGQPHAPHHRAPDSWETSPPAQPCISVLAKMTDSEGPGHLCLSPEPHLTLGCGDSVLEGPRPDPVSPLAGPGVPGQLTAQVPRTAVERGPLCPP